MAEQEPVTIVVADDDEDDRMLALDAIREARLTDRVQMVGDGVELLEYLRAAFGAGQAPDPHLVLLDLNMPRMDGRQALQEIKRDPLLRAIPVVVLTTSRSEEDLVRSYDLGANSFMTKPVSFAGLVDAMKVLGRYWFEIVEIAPVAPR